MYVIPTVPYYFDAVSELFRSRPNLPGSRALINKKLIKRSRRLKGIRMIKYEGKLISRLNNVDLV